MSPSISSNKSPKNQSQAFTWALVLALTAGMFSASLANAGPRKKSRVQEAKTQECAFALESETPTARHHFWDVGAESDPVSGGSSRRNNNSDVTADEDTRGESEFSDLAF